VGSRATRLAWAKLLEDSDMNAPKLEVPTELRNMAEKAIEEAEKAFAMFLDAANKSVASIPHPTRCCPPGLLRMLLVFRCAHSLSSGVPFAHVRTIFSVSVIVSTGEMVDF
jgi:hypothetical protein